MSKLDQSYVLDTLKDIEESLEKLKKDTNHEQAMLLGAFLNLVKSMKSDNDIQFHLRMLNDYVKSFEKTYK